MQSMSDNEKELDRLIDKAKLGGVIQGFIFGCAFCSLLIMFAALFMSFN